MGDSRPPAAADIDLVSSYARRRGQDIEIVLADPKTELPQTPVRLTLTRGRRTVEASGQLADDAPGRRLTVRAPGDRFSDGIWALTLHAGPSTTEQIDARLLVQGRRPLVLLWGATGAPSLVPKRTQRRASARVITKASHAFDAALSVLPEERARKVRAQAHAAARRVIG
jgi:hypothetical protein